jgi:hypothetical protein
VTAEPRPTQQSPVDDAPPDAFLAAVRPFPTPTGLLAGLFTLWQHEPDGDDPASAANGDQLVAPWDPTALPAEALPDLHRWLSQVVGHLNET